MRILTLLLSGVMLAVPGLGQADAVADAMRVALQQAREGLKLVQKGPRQEEIDRARAGVLSDHGKPESSSETAFRASSLNP